MAELDIPNGSHTVTASTADHGVGTTLHGAVNGNGPAKKRATIAVVGAGQRGQTYANYALQHPEEAQVVAVAEPRPHRLKVMSRQHQVPQEMQFQSWEDLHAKGRVADAVMICVLDDLHAELVTAFSAQGYHILCEKPMATKVSDCVQMVQDVQKAQGTIFGIGHGKCFAILAQGRKLTPVVLRYSPYNKAVKEVIESGALGDIVNIKHIEPVGNQHFAHSFVRGNWHKEADTSFGLMTKCCHDIDILSYYLSGLAPQRVHSFGSIHHFKPARKPKEAGNAKRCTDCAYEPECVWSAKKIYLDPLKQEKNKYRWSQHIVDADVLDIENITDALKTGPYGRCVYECGNDIVDHQVVNIEYEDGVTASMTMSAFTESECDRRTEIHGTRGELIGDMKTFTVFDFLTRTKKHYSPPDEGGHHGGGDIGLARAFVRAVAKDDQRELHVTPDEVLNSHLTVFAAEKARREGQVVDFGQFKAGAMAGEPVF